MMLPVEIRDVPDTQAPATLKPVTIFRISDGGTEGGHLDGLATDGPRKFQRLDQQSMETRESA